MFLDEGQVFLAFFVAIASQALFGVACGLAIRPGVCLSGLVA